MINPLRRPKSTIDFNGVQVACNLCGSHDHEVVAKKDRDGYQASKVLCRDCGLIFSNPMPSIEESREFYNKKSELMQEQGANIKLKRVYRAASRAIPRYNRIKRILKETKDVLEIGAGYGEFVYMLTSKGFNACGTETNETFIEYAKREYDIELYKGLTSDVDIKPESQDLIASYHNLNLQVDPLGELIRYRGWLRTSGYLNIEVPNIEAEHHAPYNRFRFKHFYNFNYYTLLAMAKKAGFEVKNTILIPRSHHINTILQKVDSDEGAEVKSCKNYLTVRNSVKGYKSLHYLMTKSPYTRVVNNLNKQVKERRVSKKFKTGREIVDDLFKGI